MLLSALVERFSVSSVRDFLYLNPSLAVVITMIVKDNTTHGAKNKKEVKNFETKELVNIQVAIQTNLVCSDFL